MSFLNSGRPKGKINPNVKAWSEGVVTTQLFLSVVTLLELEMGIGLIERRDTDQAALLRTWFNHQVLPAFHGRILAVDTDVALRCSGCMYLTRVQSGML